MDEYSIVIDHSFPSPNPTDSSGERVSKQRHIVLTPNLVIPSTPARKTSEFFDSLNNLDPVKFSPPDPVANSKMVITSDSRATYSNFAKLNPFFDERHTQIGDFYDTQAFEPIKVTQAMPPNRVHPRSPGMPHSQSESNIDFRSHVTKAHNPPTNIDGRGNHHATLSEDSDPSSVTSRGRSFSRTPSPIKVLEDIMEDLSPVSPPSPIKRSRSPLKQMFGEHGWLGKSMSMKELPNEEYRKTGLKHWGGKIKQRVEHITEDISKFVPTTLYHHESPPKSSSKTKFHVSLSPPLQAKLYSEIELMICATANQYLNIQQREGRMTVESITKITQWWASKNRPQVIEFMFDQATQHDLVLYNLKTFRFYGPNAEDLVSMNTMMQSWKALAREMSVRTFCTPDSVMRKQMHDCYKILEMLGAPLVTFLAFQELQVKALKIMRQEQKKRDEYEAIKFGVEKKWEPPMRESKEGKVEELENPFA